MSAAPVRAEYAVFAVFELARAFQSRQPISAQKIATKYQISGKFLAVVLQDLKKSGLVSTVRGSLGGFRLIPKPEELTLGYVVALAEESNVKPTKKSTQNAAPPPKLAPEASAAREKFERFWREAEAKRQEYLNEILFSDLISNPKTELSLNFSI